jgi:hypothetical protein
VEHSKDQRERAGTGSAGDAAFPAADRPPPGSPDPALADLASILAAADPDDGPAEPTLAALRLLDRVRATLDDAERRLIETARDRGASWTRISAALGLASRQAAEQRWLRLCGDSGRDPGPIRTTRRRQHSVDSCYGPELLQLRAAVLAAHRAIRADRTWDDRGPRTALARSTLAIAATADPGALFALSVQVVEDLDRTATGTLPTTLGGPLDRLRQAVATAASTGQS